jgi:integrase
MCQMAQEKNLQQHFDEYIFECEFARKLRPETLRGYRETFKLFLRLTPGASLEIIIPSLITNFFRTLEQRKRLVGNGIIKTGVKKSTIATYWSKLSGFFEWLKNKNLLPQNPFREMAYPTPTYEDKKFLSRNEIEKILTAILNHSDKNILTLKRNLAMFHILLFCGLRKEELLFLQVRDIDLNKRTVTVRAETSKSGRSRCVPLHSQVILYLKDYLSERKRYSTPYLFVSSKRDDRLTSDGLKHLVNTLRNRSGVRFHLHQFRHTFAVNFLKSSNNVAKLKQLLGHQNIAMTLQYLRCLPTNEMRGDIESMSIDLML